MIAYAPRPCRRAPSRCGPLDAPRPSAKPGRPSRANIPVRPMPTPRTERLDPIPADGARRAASGRVAPPVARSLGVLFASLSALALAAPAEGQPPAAAQREVIVLEAHGDASLPWLEALDEVFARQRVR